MPDPRSAHQWLRRAAALVYAFLALVGILYLARVTMGRAETMFVALGGAIGMQLSIAFVERQARRRQALSARNG